jgi:hypothetical protein
MHKPKRTRTLLAAGLSLIMAAALTACGQTAQGPAATAKPADFRDIEFARLAWYFNDDTDARYSFMLYDNDGDGVSELYGSGTNLAIGSSFENGALMLRMDTHGGAAGNVTLSYDQTLKKVLLFSGYYSVGIGNENILLARGAAQGTPVISSEWEMSEGDSDPVPQVTRHLEEIDGIKIPAELHAAQLPDGSAALLNLTVDCAGTTFDARLAEFEAYAKAARGEFFSLKADIDGDGTEEGVFLFSGSHADVLNGCAVYDAGEPLPKADYENSSYVPPLLWYSVADRVAAVVADQKSGQAVFMTVQLPRVGGRITGLAFENGSAVAVTSSARYALTYTPGENAFAAPVLTTDDFIGE